VSFVSRPGAHQPVELRPGPSWALGAAST